MHFTPTEERILKVLGDGKPHSVEELMGCLWDNLSSRGALMVSICQIRKKLKPHRQYIVCLEATGEHPTSYVHTQPRVSSPTS